MTNGKLPPDVERSLRQLSDKDARELISKVDPAVLYGSTGKKDSGSKRRKRKVEKGE